MWVSERLGNFKIPTEVQEMVQRLQRAGYSTGVLTNGHAEVSTSIEKQGLLGWLELTQVLVRAGATGQIRSMRGIGTV